MKRIIQLFGCLCITLLGSTVLQAETVLITGSNKGIGLAFAQQYAAKGWTVIATARKPEKAQELQKLAKQYPDTVLIEKLDVTNDEQIAALSAKYKDSAIDVLLNNAGTTGSMKDEMFGRLNYEVLQWEFEVNALGPLKMAEAFAKQVRASEQRKIIAVSSSMGSIEKTFGYMYGYRASKAALNMYYKNLAMEMKKKKKNPAIVALVNPGQTRTDLMKEVPGELKEPAVAATELIAIIDKLTLDNAGQFFQYDGSLLPW